jgi:hypothetical protein
MQGITEPQTAESNVVELFAAASQQAEPQLSNEELVQLRRMMREFAIIRGTCPLAVRALSTRV